MGFKVEFNWVLKLKPSQGLDEKALKVGQIYNFSKKENRVYPIGSPIDLVSQNWQTVARVVVLEFKNTANNTKGKYKIIKIYKGKEKKFLTDYWQETLQVN